MNREAVAELQRATRPTNTFHSEVQQASAPGVLRAALFKEDFNKAMYLAMAHSRLGEFSIADQYFREIAALQEEQVSKFAGLVEYERALIATYLYWSVSRQAAGDPNQARNHLRDAVRVFDPQRKLHLTHHFGESWWLLSGIALTECNRRDQALQAAAKAIEQYGGREDRWILWLAILYARLGDRATAQEWQARFQQWQDRSKQQDAELQAGMVELSSLLEEFSTIDASSASSLQ
jgi:tetratricopeptide (TPR) repeat protein